MTAETAVIRDAVARLSGIGEPLAEPEFLAKLHGNARRGLAKELRNAGNRLADVVQPAIDGLEATADRIEAAS